MGLVLGFRGDAPEREWRPTESKMSGLTCHAAPTGGLRIWEVRVLRLGVLEASREEQILAQPLTLRGLGQLSLSFLLYKME